MASTSASEVKINNADEEIDIWSIGNCVICNMQLTGGSKILICLHIVCKDCIAKKSSVSGVECKCLSVTKGKLIDYHIESSNLSINKNHDTNSILTYPMLEALPSCSNCSDSYADVYCIECSISLCQFCHIHSHHDHNYKVLEKFRDEINSNVLLEKFKLESNSKNLDFFLEETEKKIENMEIRKRSIYEEIDKETEMSYKEISKRAFELKYLVDSCFFDTIGETYKNRQTFKDLQNKNKYYIDIAKSILSHNNLSDIINVSRVVLTKLENVNNHTMDISNVTSKLEIDLKNNFYETMDNCISNFKELGNIIASPVFNSSKTNVINTPNNVCQPFVHQQTAEEEVNTKSQFDMVTDNLDCEPCIYKECSCCLQLGDKLVKCFLCKRSYHNYCHVPLIPDENVTVTEKFECPMTSLWICTMCEDITKFSKALEDQKSTTDAVSIGAPGRKIAQRILMELYCQNYDSVHFRDCPSKRVYAEFYKKISNPISLNIIKYNLESNMYYTTLVHVINDLRQVFLNALIFYHPSNGYYESADELLTSLNSMIANWIPKLETNKN